ncbi:MAG: family 16 glycosylhydrolase [Bacilli bacterium]|nr:family 16 glycosylhydrolase [Bacilli bacterium]
MHKKHLKTILPLSLMFTLGLAGCGISKAHKPPKDTPKLEVHSIANFGEGENEKFFKTNGFGNGSPFNVLWSASQANIVDDHLDLTLAANANYAAGGETDATKYPHLAGEYRSLDFYGYGDFSVTMKPSAVKGTASTFFTYTGEWDSETLHPSTGSKDTRNPGNEQGIHDEIDIEFLGKDTTKVQFNYFTNGVGGHEYMYSLGFDASLEYHTYGFRWTEESIIWFVDGEAVYQATKNIPTHPGRIITNYWAGDNKAAAWMGNFAGDYSGAASYKEIGATSEGTHTALEVSDGPVESLVDWSTVAPRNLSLGESSAEYSVSLSDDAKTVDVTYEAISGGSYKQVALNAPEGIEGCNAVQFTVKNNGEKSVNFRADINSSSKHGENKITAINTKATVDGVAMGTDLTWGGSTTDIAAGSEVIIEIWYKGDISYLGFMIDSAYNGPSTPTAGSITMKDFKFAKDGEEGDLLGDVIDQDPIDTPSDLVDPTAPENPEGGVALSMWASDSTIYKWEEQKLTYVNATGWCCVGTDFPAEQSSANHIKFSISSGTTTKVVVQIQNPDGKLQKPHIETSGAGSSWDQDDGVGFEVTNGVLNVDIDYGAGAKQITMFVGSTGEASSGIVRFSTFAFSTVENGLPPFVQGGETGDSGDTPVEDTSVAMTFWTDAETVYSFEGNKVTYRDASEWKNFGCSIPEDKLGSKKVSFSVTTEEEEAKMLIKILDAEDNALGYSATADGNGYTWGDAGTTDHGFGATKGTLNIDIELPEGAAKFIIFLGSIDETAKSGVVEFSNFKFVKDQAEETPVEQGTAMTFWTGAETVYSFEGNKVTYKDASEWKNFGCNIPEDKVGSNKVTFSMTTTEAESKMLIKILDAEDKALGYSATADGNGYTWGDAGTTDHGFGVQNGTLNVSIDLPANAAKFCIFLGSIDETAKSGVVEFSNFFFSTVIAE